MEILGYEGLTQVGAGGNAHVYRAIQAATGDVVAIKVLRGGGDQAVIRRFERERSLMAELETIANVVPIYESGLDASGDPYLVMPLYTGGSLQDHVEAGQMPWRDAVELTKTLTESIALAHAKRILHLDVKPANVLLDGEGRPWLADFGIAEMMGHTASMSAQMMTPAFTPPERLDGSKPDELTDLYGLMATLFALLTGQAPYVTDAMTGPLGVMRAILQDPLSVEQVPAGTPKSARNLLMRGMAKDPTERPRSAIELVGLLEDVLDGREVAAPVAPGVSTAEVPNLPVVMPDAGSTVVVAQSASQALRGTPPVPEEVDSKRGVLILAGLVMALMLAGGVLAASVFSGGDDGEDVALETTNSEAPDVDVAQGDAAINEPDENVAVEIAGKGEAAIADVETSDSDDAGDRSTRGAAAADAADAPATTAARTGTTRAAPTTRATAAPAATTTTTTGRATTTTKRATTTTTARATTTTATPTTTTTTSTTSTPTTTTTTAKPVVTTPVLEAGFRASKGPTGSEQTISFANITIGEATTYRWDFGDGETSTQMAPSHTYAAAGTYNVTITATGPSGSDSATHPVRVDANTEQFEAGWTASAQASPNQQTLDFRSITIGDATSFTWNFGDGSSGAGATISHAYAAPGTYSITITATGPGGTDSATHTVQVDPNA